VPDPGRVMEDNFSGFVARTVKSIREGKKDSEFCGPRSPHGKKSKGKSESAVYAGNARSLAQGTRIRDLIAN
jgi:hypothetical protein